MKNRCEFFDIEFQIERLSKDGSTDPEVINLDVDCKYEYSSGVFHKLPEDCYPAEVEISLISATDENGKSWQEDLRPEEVSSIKKKIEDMAARHIYAEEIGNEEE